MMHAPAESVQESRDGESAAEESRPEQRCSTRWSIGDVDHAVQYLIRPVASFAEFAAPVSCLVDAAAEYGLIRLVLCRAVHVRTVCAAVHATKYDAVKP